MARACSAGAPAKKGLGFGSAGLKSNKIKTVIGCKLVAYFSTIHLRSICLISFGMRGGRLKERDSLFELVLKWITHSEVRDRLNYIFLFAEDSHKLFAV
jgi:hypothetical protein